MEKFWNPVWLSILFTLIIYFISAAISWELSQLVFPLGYMITGIVGALEGRRNKDKIALFTWLFLACLAAIGLTIQAVRMLGR